MKGSIDFKESDECVRQEVWDKLFMGVFGTEEVSKYMLQSFARAMAGEIKDKRLFFIIGEPNSGKGTITEVFRLVFASQFNTLNAQDFCAKKSDGTLPSPTNIWFRGGTNASPFSTRPLEPGSGGTPKLSRCFRIVERASRAVSTTIVKPSASSTNRLGSAT